MIRGLLVLFIVYVVLVISALADCLGGEHAPRRLPRFAWALAILLVPVVGAVMWFATGRPRADARRPGPHLPPPSTSSRGQKAPDDDPEFLAELARRLKKKEEDGGK